MYSMTGFGKGTAVCSGRELTIELKSVNHRFLDIGLRLPRHLNGIEDEIRRTLGERLSRGHVDVFVNYRNTRSDSKTVRVDTALITAYVSAARSLPAELCLRDDLSVSTALKLPDVTEIAYADEDPDALIALCKEALSSAIDMLLVMRKKEGESIRADLSEKLCAMREIADGIRERAPLIAETYRQKLNERIASAVGEADLDRARLATEVALFADRAAVDEEIARLSAHLDGFALLLDADEPVGRKMDFVVQEMNRECNTIGSKANDQALTELVLRSKSEIEKLREQIQNVE